MTDESSLAAATCLLDGAPEILRRWETRVRAQIPASRAQLPLALRNNLAPLLTEVARALSPTGEPQTLIAGLSLSEDHGSHRALLAEYHIGEVFLEYRLLRQAILEVLDEGAVITPAHREVINSALERAMQDAVSQFAQVQHLQERTAADEARRVAEELRQAYERERRIAEMLQRPLLLKVAEDSVPGLSLATFYEPALREAEVGGDFFDVVPLSGGKVALVVGDTCGKGLEAAVHNTQLKDVLRAFLREDSRHPRAVLGRLNNVTCDLLEDGGPEEGYRFVVLALLILQPGSGKGLFSSAGAEPLALIRADGKAEVVTLPGLPLGIQRDVEYAEQPIHLRAGDTAALVTDGIPEARRSGEQLGHPGMVDLVREGLRAPTLQEAGEHILAAARSFGRGDLKDDACLVLARRR